MFLVDEAKSRNTHIKSDCKDKVHTFIFWTLSRQELLWFVLLGRPFTTNKAYDLSVELSPSVLPRTTIIFFIAVLRSALVVKIQQDSSHVSHYRNSTTVKSTAGGDFQA